VSEKPNLDFKRRAYQPINLNRLCAGVCHVNDLVFGMVRHQISEVQTQSAAAVLVPIDFIVVWLVATEKSVVSYLNRYRKEQVSIYMYERIVTT
jgi:hypothetical protein